MGDFDDIRAFHAAFRKADEECDFKNEVGEDVADCLRDDFNKAEAAMERLEGQEIWTSYRLIERRVYAEAREQAAKMMEDGSKLLVDAEGDRMALYRVFREAFAAEIRSMEPEGSDE